jgi:hypothetical protein
MLDNPSECISRIPECEISEYRFNLSQYTTDTVASDSPAGVADNAAARCGRISSRGRQGCPWDALRCAVLGAVVWLSLPGTPALALKPPEPFVLAADGVTKLTLEQAGILRPNGRKWALILAACRT